MSGLTTSLLRHEPQIRCANGEAELPPPDILASMYWQDVPCPLCGDRDENELLNTEEVDKGFRLVRCRSCAMTYLNPRPDEQAIKHFYQEDYVCYQPRETEERPESRSEARTRFVLSHLCGMPQRQGGLSGYLQALLTSPWFHPGRDSMRALRYHGEGKLLDFGCGSGTYALWMKRLGWEVTGLDFSEHAAAQARQHGFPVHVGTLPHPEIKPESFDIITMGAVLEHVHDPHRVVAAATEALRPGGKLVITVPNIDGSSFWFFGRDWYGLQLPLHLLHFSRNTLARLLTHHGLKCTELRSIRRAGWVRRSFKAAGKRPESRRRFLVRLGQSRVISSALCRWSGWIRQADCLYAVGQKN